jgi:hypothetical protein
MSTSQVDQRRISDSIGAINGYRRHSSRLFYTAGAALGISVFLPWASIAGIVSSHISGVGVAVMLLFAAAHATIGYRVQFGHNSRALCGGAWILNVVVGFVVFAVYYVLGKTEGIVEPTVGIFVASVGALVGIAATIMLHMTRSQHSGSAC